LAVPVYGENDWWSALPSHRSFPWLSRNIDQRSKCHVCLIEDMVEHVHIFMINWAVFC